MKNLKILLFLTPFLFFNNFVNAAPCDYTQAGQLSTEITFNSIITCNNGDVTLNDMNSNPGGDGKVRFTTSVTLNSLTINFASGNKPIEFIIDAGVTVTILGSLTFSGQADKDKFLTINGNLIVGGTLDLGSLEFEIDGSGTIDAGSIISAGDTTCGLDGNCPTITADTCTGGGLCAEPGAVTLPIELLSFRGYESNSKINLEWSTASEINNDYFSIERSQDGLAYELITTMPGAGNSTSVLEYAYTDKNPLLGRSYYRLKQTDFDGASETFTPVAVDYSTLEGGELGLSPNPVNRGQRIIIATQADANEVLTISVFNMLGEAILKEKFSGASYEFVLDRNTKQGIYFVEISSVNTQKRGRLLVN